MAMRLEAVGRQLEAWEIPLESSWRCLDPPKPPLESCWRRLGGSNASSGELLEVSWKLPEPTWMPLASLRGLLGALGIVLEASWELLERS